MNTVSPFPRYKSHRYYRSNPCASPAPSRHSAADRPVPCGFYLAWVLVCALNALLSALLLGGLLTLAGFTPGGIRWAMGGYGALCFVCLPLMTALLRVRA